MIQLNTRFESYVFRGKTLYDLALRGNRLAFPHAVPAGTAVLQLPKQHRMPVYRFAIPSLVRPRFAREQTRIPICRSHGDRGPTRLLVCCSCAPTQLPLDEAVSYCGIFLVSFDNASTRSLPKCLNQPLNQRINHAHLTYLTMGLSGLANNLRECLDQITRLPWQSCWSGYLESRVKPQ